MNIKIVTNEEEAKKADELLTKLIWYEKQYDNNINGECSAGYIRVDCFNGGARCCQVRE